MTDSREAFRGRLDELAQDAIANGVDQTAVREEAEKFADRVRLTEAVAEEIETADEGDTILFDEARGRVENLSDDGGG